MSAFKLSMRFRYLSGDTNASSRNIPGGWTESVYWDNASDSTKASFLTLAQKRAAFLPNFTAITGLRYQQVDPTAPSSLQRVNIPGQAVVGFIQDVPQVAMYLSIPARDRTNVRKYFAAALPDNVVIRGEFRPGGAWATFFKPFVDELNGWKFRGQDLTIPRVDIKTIDATGAYVLNTPQTVANGDVVTVYSTVDGNGKKITGKFKLATVTDTTHGVLLNWTAGACTKGQFRKYTVVYPVLNTTGISPDNVEISIRRIGRPPVRYVGRRSRRRK